MAEAAATIVSLVVPALHITRLLLDDVKTIKDAPREIEDLAKDVESYAVCLELLSSVQQTEWESRLGADASDKTQKAIRSCEEACTEFRAKLTKWTEHSSKLSRWRRFRMGFFEKEQIRTLQRNLQSGKSSLNDAITIANL